jgi:hypothetical protein
MEHPTTATLLISGVLVVPGILLTTATRVLIAQMTATPAIAATLAISYYNNRRM